MKHFYDRELLESRIFGEEMPDVEEMPEMEEIPDAEFMQPEPDGEIPEGEEDLDEPWAEFIFTLTMEDGSEVICRAESVFLENEKEYIALDMGDDVIQIMELSEGVDDSILLLPVEDDEEREAAFRAFLEIMGTEKGEDYDGNQDREEN